MNPEPVHAILWSEEKRSRLQACLTGEWAEDTWILIGREKGKQIQHLFHFAFRSSWLVLEFKYALWYQLTHGMGRSPSSQGKLFYQLRFLVSWLNHVAPTAHSLLERDLAFWDCSLRTWLVESGHYSRPSKKSLQATQTYQPCVYEDRRISLFRLLYHTLAEVYDDRPETEKDIWDLRKLSIPLNLSTCLHRLNFTVLSQPWLRSLAKHYLKYNLTIHSASDCANKLSAIRQFSHFLAQEAPQTPGTNLDRALILRYLSYLQEQKLAVAVRHRYLVNLRTFLETCVHQLHVSSLMQEPLIFNDDLPKLPDQGTREIPEEVLVQFRTHLEALPTTTLRMVTILLETGLRLNELCQLPVDCLICDDKHEWYLRLYQSKTHWEHVIPLVETAVVGAIQAQQQDIRAKWGNDCPYLFPSPTSHTKPCLQPTFTRRLNEWAVKYQIKDRKQKLYHFTAHQFRHTLGMKLINEDVPLEVVSRLLGHRSLSMTQIYARVRDKKVRADLERVAHKRKTVDYQGNAVKGDPRANDSEVQMTRKGVRGQTLGVGGCARLIVLGDCTHANKCLTCPMWLTSTEDLPALKSFYDRAIRLKQRAIEKGNQIVTEQQDRIIPTLALRIKSLETTEMDGSLCVDDVLAQLRTDLAEAACGLEEAQASGLVLAARHLERAITEMKMRIAALEVPDDRPHD